MIRLRLTDFCNIIGEDRGAFRAVLARRHAPFDPEPEAGQKQRTYGGADLLAWLLYNRLRAQGIPAASAGEDVIASLAVCDFFAASAEGRAGLCLFRAVERIRRTVPLPGVIEVTHHATGGPDLLAHMLARRAYGAEVHPVVPRPGDAPRTHLGFDAFVIVPILPAFEEARARLKPHGLDLDGPEIVEING